MSGTRIKKAEIETARAKYEAGLFRKVISVEEFLDAAAAGNCKVVQQYIKQDGDRFNYAYNCKAMDVTDFSKRTALILAAQNGHLSVVLALLASKINVNAIDRRGQSALIGAVVKGHIEVVRELLKASDIDINLVTESNETALSIASFDGKTEIADMIKHAMQIKKTL
jgi:ankyrin repeat protein